MIPRRKPIRVKAEKKAKKVVKNPRVPRTVNAQTETLSMHMGKIRSALRNMTRYGWKPISQVRKAAQRGYMKVAGKPKPLYQCAMCLEVVMKGQVDHINPAGSLRSYADLPLFCERLFCENVDDLRFLCTGCHKKVTHE